MTDIAFTGDIETDMRCCPPVKQSASGSPELNSSYARVCLTRLALSQSSVLHLVIQHTPRPQLSAITRCCHYHQLSARLLTSPPPVVSSI